MVKLNEKQLFEKLTEIKYALDSGVEGVSETRGKAIKKNIIIALKNTDKPDYFYPTQSRVVKIMVFLFAAILFTEIVSALILKLVFGYENMELYAYIAGVTILALMFLTPSSDSLTETIIRSENFTIRKIFIPRKKEQKTEP